MIQVRWPNNFEQGAPAQPDRRIVTEPQGPAFSWPQLFLGSVLRVSSASVPLPSPVASSAEQFALPSPTERSGLAEIAMVRTTRCFRGDRPALTGLRLRRIDCFLRRHRLFDAAHEYALLLSRFLPHCDPSVCDGSIPIASTEGTIATGWRGRRAPSSTPRTSAACLVPNAGPMPRPTRSASSLPGTAAARPTRSSSASSSSASWTT